MIEFIRKYRDSLKINISRLSWPVKYNLPIYDYQFTFTKFNQIFIGRGVSRIEEDALTKAVSESIERYLCKKFKFNNTSGLAVHKNDEAGIQVAKNELLERDLFFCHFLTKTKMKELNNQFLNESCHKLLDFFKTHGAHPALYKMGGEEMFAVCAIITGFESHLTRFGVIVGSACSNSYCMSAEKALYECMIDFISIIENGSKSIPLKSFLKLNSPGPHSHLRLGRNCEYAKKFLGSYKIDFNFNSIKSGELDIKTSIIEEEFSSLGLKFYVASGEQLQPLYFGQTSQSNINMLRLREFRGGNLKFSDINQLPHPFG